MGTERITNYNPEVLKWARLRSGRIETKKFEKLKSKILEWEECKSFPTYIQLEELSEIYKIPVAVFFFPEPPEIETKRPEFRNKGNLDLSNMPNKLVQIIDKALVLKMNLDELFRYSNKKPKDILSNLSLLDFDDLLIELRDLLNVSIEEQIKLNPDDLLKRFREELFKNGIFVFKEPFYTNSVSGFCIYDEEFPIIFLNNSMTKTRQLFTLFHEIYHLITKSNSIDEIDYSSNRNDIEFECDNFASAFLIPKKECLALIKDIDMSFESIQKLAQHFSVSFEAMLIRLISLKILDWDWYNKFKNKFHKDNYPKKNKNSGGNPYNNKLAYLGTNYINLAFDAYNTGNIDSIDLSEYLGINRSNLNKFTENWSQ